MLREEMAKLEALQEARNKKMAAVEGTIEKKVFLLMKAHDEKAFYAKAVKELKEAARALNQTVLHLEHQQEQQEAETFSPEKFSKMKGKLPFPLKGKIVKNVEQLGSNPFMHRKGVYIQGSPGEEVRSIFLGKIDYSGWFKGYGQMVIVNHGSHYFTLFAHLEERVGQEGNIVSGGEVIGLAGDPGWDVGPGVYFEIRKGGDNLEPEKWLSAK
jgi:murein hydrolase activator